MAMTHSQADLDCALRHVADGERRVREQRARLARRDLAGLQTEEARRFLHIMEVTLEQFRWHAQEIAKDVKPL
jgi:hypothetical protein